MTANPPTQHAARRGILTFNDVLSQALLTRGTFSRLLDPRRDIYKECGYPETLTRENYREIYDRNGIAARVVEIYPNECWAMSPDLVETERPTLTPFEATWADLEEEFMLNHFMERVDVLSGIGHFGVLLFGLNDGGDLADPVPGIGDGAVPAGLELLFVRAFDETLVDIDEYEQDPTNPRFGRPVMYSITFFDPNNDAGYGTGRDTTRKKVHWTRVLHVADNLQSSEIFGRPRLKPVFNHILDHRKVLGGGAEMFWKGGFPGYSFEVDPTIGDVDLDKDSIRQEFENYGNGLSRYLAMAGGSVKSLASTPASPEHHDRGQLQAICIAIGVPMRVFVGSEEAKLSSTQDARTWHKRLHRRQAQHIFPQIIRPLVERFIAYGLLPAPRQPYRVAWPDLNTPTDEDRAAVAAKRVEALSKYMVSGADALIGPEAFLMYIMGEPYERVRLILEESESRIDAGETFADDEVERTPTPVAPAGGAGTGGNGGGFAKPRPAPKRAT